MHISMFRADKSIEISTGLYILLKPKCSAWRTDQPTREVKLHQPSKKTAVSNLNNHSHITSIVVKLC